MDRPLWQIVMAIMVLGLAAQRAAAGIAYYASAHEPLLVTAYIAQGLCGVMLWASLLWVRRLVATATVLLGMSVAVTALLAGFVLRRLPISTAFAQVAIAITLSVAFLLFARRVLDRD